jgi:IS1 family transposase
MVKKLLGENRLEGLKQLRSLLACIWHGTPSDQTYLESRIKVLEAKLGRRAKQHQKLLKQVQAQSATTTTTTDYVFSYTDEEYKDFSK